MNTPFIAGLYGLSNFLGNFHFSDLLDIIVVAFFIYLGLVLFKRARSTAILVGLGILITIYGVARFFNFYMTTLLLQSFFGASIIVLAILFQDELRRFFETLALWGRRKKGPRVPDNTALEEVLQAILHLANNKKGALIVLPGLENTGRYIEGERALDGMVSEELLLSLFDPSSPGHDGAVVIEKDRIVSFGGHLPLSSNFTSLDKHGTRHAAALGLSERSDALLIVVSEERGTISIARNGVLWQVAGLNDLRDTITGFFSEKFPKEPQTFVASFVKKNTNQKIAAATLAFGLWIFISANTETIQRDLVLPISYGNLPSGVVVTSAAPKQVTVTFESRGSLPFESSNEGNTKVLIDGTKLKLGWNVVRLDEDNVIRPRNLNALGVAPKEVQVKLEKFKEVTRTIVVTTSGTPGYGYRVSNVEVYPKEITILAPENAAQTGTIQTKPLNLSGITEDTAYTLELVLPQDVRLPLDTDREVVVSVSVEKI